MESIKDFKRKYETLWIFFKGIPQKAIGTGINKEKQVFVYDMPPYKFRDEYRKEFDAILNQAEDYYLSCMVDEIELENEIMKNIDLIPSIKKSIREEGYCEYPQVKPRDFPWLKSLLEAQIISNLEFNLACNHIKYCAETMRYNVQMLGKLLKRHGDVTTPLKAEEQQPNSKPPKEDRKVDEDAVGNWFNAEFKGAKNNVNYLKDLVEDLKQNRSNKDLAKIAYLIYNCKNSLVQSNTFSKFYADFCRAVGCDKKKYEPCKLRDEEFARKFSYLQ